VKLWFVPLFLACVISLSFLTAKGQEQEQLYQANIRIRGTVSNVQNNVTIQSFSTSHTFTAVISVTIKEILQKPETFDQTDCAVVSYDYLNPPSVQTGDAVEVYGFWFPALDTPWSRTIRIDDQVSGSYITNIADVGPVYEGIAQYYDNRKAAVTISFDDWAGSGEKYEAGLAMLTRKRLYYTAGIITKATNINWTEIQRWLDKGYMEVGSHSRTHQHIPYTDYDSEVGGSKADIMGNLTLPALSSFNSTEYVYTWIEPYGQSDSSVRQRLGIYGYLADRTVFSEANGWATWDNYNNLFNKVGYTVEMGNPPLWQGTHDAAKLNAKFDQTFNTHGIYHLIFHPNWVDWTPDAYADNHTTYISHRPDVWYVSFGNLYLYHWTATRNIVEVSSEGFGENKNFRISLPVAARRTYGVRYPITYIFNIPSSWTGGHTHYRHKETDQWTPLPNKNSENLFNGINASRFDFTNHKAYVSIGYAETSSNIYILLQSNRSDTIPPVAEAGQDLTVSEGQPVFFNASQSHDNIAIAQYHWDLGDGTNATTQTTIHTYMRQATYTVTLKVTDAFGNSDSDTLTLTVTPAPLKPLPQETIEIAISTTLSACIIAGAVTLKKRKITNKGTIIKATISNKSSLNPTTDLAD